MSRVFPTAVAYVMDGRTSCLAIDEADGNDLGEPWGELAIWYQDLFDLQNKGGFEIWGDVGLFERREIRILMLCFAAAIAKSEGL